MPISVTARPTPRQIAGDEEDELDRPEHAGDQQIADPAERARIDQLPPQASHVTAKSRAAGHARRYGKPHRDGTMLPWRTGAHSSSWPRQGQSCWRWRPPGRSARRAAARSREPALRPVEGRLHRGIDVVSAGAVGHGGWCCGASRAGAVRVRLRPARRAVPGRELPAALRRECSVLDPPTDRCSAARCTSSRRGAVRSRPSRGRGHGLLDAGAPSRRLPVHPPRAGGPPLVRGRAISLVRADRQPRPPARLRAAPALRDRERGRRRC